MTATSSTGKATAKNTDPGFATGRLACGRSGCPAATSLTGTRYVGPPGPRRCPCSWTQRGFGPAYCRARSEAASRLRRRRPAPRRRRRRRDPTDGLGGLGSRAPDSTATRCLSGKTQPTVSSQPGSCPPKLNMSETKDSAMTMPLVTASVVWGLGSARAKDNPHALNVIDASTRAATTTAGRNDHRAAGRRRRLRHRRSEPRRADRAAKLRRPALRAAPMTERALRPGV